MPWINDADAKRLDAEWLLPGEMVTISGNVLTIKTAARPRSNFVAADDLDDDQAMRKLVESCR